MSLLLSLESGFPGRRRRHGRGKPPPRRPVVRMTALFPSSNQSRKFRAAVTLPSPEGSRYIFIGVRRCFRLETAGIGAGGRRRTGGDGRRDDREPEAVGRWL